MTEPADPLPSDPAALRALLLAERERHATELAGLQGLAETTGADRDRARAEIERLRQIIRELQRHRFGRRSERLDPDQLALLLEDSEQQLAEAEREEEAQTPEPAQGAKPRTPRRGNRGKLPAHPRLRGGRLCRASSG